MYPITGRAIDPSGVLNYFVNAEEHGLRIVVKRNNDGSEIFQLARYDENLGSNFVTNVTTVNERINDFLIANRDGLSQPALTQYQAVINRSIDRINRATSSWYSWFLMLFNRSHRRQLNKERQALTTIQRTLQGMATHNPRPNIPLPPPGVIPPPPPPPPPSTQPPSSSAATIAGSQRNLRTNQRPQVGDNSDQSDIVDQVAAAASRSNLRPAALRVGGSQPHPQGTTGFSPDLLQNQRQGLKPAKNRVLSDLPPEAQGASMLVNALKQAFDKRQNTQESHESNDFSLAGHEDW